MQNFLSSWFHSYFFHLTFVTVLLVTVCYPFFFLRRRLRSVLRQHNLWRELEHTILELSPEACHYYPDPSRHVLQSVLARPHGVARAGAIEPALDYLAAELDSCLNIMRSLSYLAVLVGLLGTVTLLALALQSVDAIGQFKIEQLKNIYPLNAVAIGLAVVMYLSFSWYRYQGDTFLLQVARVLSRLRVDELGAADPVLLATLEKVGEKFQDWSKNILAEQRQEIQRLVQEMRALGDSIRELVVSAIAARQAEDQALTPLLRSQEAKLEILNQRLYQNYLLLTKRTGRPDELADLKPGLDDQVWPGSKPRERQARQKTSFWRRFFKE